MLEIAVREGVSSHFVYAIKFFRVLGVVIGVERAYIELNRLCE